MRQKVEFQSNGITLSGALESPEAPPRCYALFAHCFTCGKDAVSYTHLTLPTS